MLGTSLAGISTPRSPLAIIIPSATSQISSILFTPERFSILAIMSISFPLLESKKIRISSISCLQETKEAATKSTWFSIPNRRSSLSCSLKNSCFITRFGKFMLLELDSSPPTITLHFAREELRPTTLKITSPLFTRMVSPISKFSISCLKFTETICSSPIMSSVVNVKSSPS